MNREFRIIKNVILAFTLFISSGCDDKLHNKDNLTEFEFVEYKLPPLCLWKEFSQDQVLMINGYRDFVRYIKISECMPVVDFSKHTLILAGGETTSGISRVDNELLKRGKIGLTTKVTVLLNFNGSIDHWTVAYLTSKLSSTKVDLEVHIIK